MKKIHMYAIFVYKFYIWNPLQFHNGKEKNHPCMYPVPKVWFLMLILNHRPKSGLRGLTYPHIHFSSCCMYTRIKYLSISFYNKFSCNFNWECSILDFHLAMFTEVKILIIFPFFSSQLYTLCDGRRDDLRLMADVQVISVAGLFCCQVQFKITKFQSPYLWKIALWECWSSDFGAW